MLNSINDTVLQRVDTSLIIHDEVRQGNTIPQCGWDLFMIITSDMYRVFLLQHTSLYVKGKLKTKIDELNVHYWVLLEMLVTKYVRVYDKRNNNNLEILFDYDEKKMKFLRIKGDELNKTLIRMSLKLVARKEKKKKKSQETVRPVIDVRLLDVDDSIYDGKETNVNCFKDNCQLKINNEMFTVIVNPPSVLEMCLPDCIMAGLPIFPHLVLESTLRENCRFSWYKADKLNCDCWKLVGNAFVYEPSNADVGFYLKCVCIPGADTLHSYFKEEHCSVVEVTAGPGVCLYNNRHFYTKFHVESNQFIRVISYNILADVFCDSEFGRTVLYPHCPEYALKSSYRRSMVLKEILGFHCDIICLQECESKIFEKYLSPALEIFGYKGQLNLKTGAMPEGEALFYRCCKYKHVSDASVAVKDALYAKCNEHLLKLIENTSLVDSVRSSIAIGQIHILKERTNDCRTLCVLNTHLYYKPFAHNIRLLQIAILMNYLCDVIKLQNEPCSVIVCGDMNSLKCTVPQCYLDGHSISSSTLDLESDSEFQCPIKLQNMTSPSLFTVFVNGFKGNLDYIYADGDFQLESFIPLPTSDEIEVYTALPCPVASSDHLPLVVDLKWFTRHEKRDSDV